MFSPDNTLILFKSPEDFFARLCGASQHDAHMQAFRVRRNLDRMAAQGDAGMAAVYALTAELEEERAQRVAADYNFNTGALRAALDRWQTGCFSGADAPDYRAARVRQLSRALDIAVDRRTLQAAE